MRVSILVLKIREFIGMGGNFLTPFIVNGRQEGCPYPMPFNGTLHPVPDATLDALFASTKVVSGTLSGRDERNIPLDQRQNLFEYSMQLGNLLD
jgi:hypothetical protein